MRRKNRLQVLCQSVGGEPLPLLVQSDGKAVIIRYLRDSPFGQGGFFQKTRFRNGSATRFRSENRTCCCRRRGDNWNPREWAHPNQAGPVDFGNSSPADCDLKAELPEEACGLAIGAQVAVPFGASESHESRKGTAGSNRRRLLYLRHSYNAPAQAIVGVVFFSAASNTRFPR
jgi:hypothetical protein